MTHKDNALSKFKQFMMSKPFAPGLTFKDGLTSSSLKLSGSIHSEPLIEKASKQEQPSQHNIMPNSQSSNQE